jgi:FMN reductase
MTRPLEPSMTERSIVVVTAGIGKPSATRLLADRLGASTARALQEEGHTAAITVVELRDHARDLTDHLLTGFPSPALKATIEGVLAAEGVIAVSPVYSASFSGLFKLFWDVIERDGLAGRPVLVAATGGTARHSLVLEHAMRPLFAYLNAAVVPTGVYAASEDWGRTGGTDVGLVERIDRAARELAMAVAHRAPARATSLPEEPVPFETLLRGTRPD